MPDPAVSRKRQILGGCGCDQLTTPRPGSHFGASIWFSRSNSPGCRRCSARARRGHGMISGESRRRRMPDARCPATMETTESGHRRVKAAAGRRFPPRQRQTPVLRCPGTTGEMEGSESDQVPAASERFRRWVRSESGASWMRGRTDVEPTLMCCLRGNFG